MSAPTINEIKKANNPANKTKKRDSYVYGNIDGKVDFHPLSKFKVQGLEDSKMLVEVIQGLRQELEKKDKQIEKQNKINKKMLKRIKILESKVKTYVG